MVRPGELNLMTAGAGICHSEVSTAGSHRSCTASSCGSRCPTPTATPAATSPTTFRGPAPWRERTVRVFLGELGGQPLPGAHLHAAARRPGRPRVPAPTVTLDVDRTFEHGVLLDQGERGGGGTHARRRRSLRISRPATIRLALANRGDGPARVLLLGGPPFGEQLVMWWNFVGRSHDDIVGLPRSSGRTTTRASAPSPAIPGAAPARTAAADHDPASPVPIPRPQETMTTDRTGAATTVTEEPGPLHHRRRRADRRPGRLRRPRRASASSPTPRSTAPSGPRAGDHPGRPRRWTPTRKAGLRIVPACSMVADYIDKHPEFADLTDPV